MDESYEFGWWKEDICVAYRLPLVIRKPEPIARSQVQSSIEINIPKSLEHSEQRWSSCYPWTVKGFLTEVALVLSTMSLHDGLKKKKIWTAHFVTGPSQKLSRAKTISVFASGKMLFTEANVPLLSRGEVCSERVWLEGLFSNPYIYSKFDNPTKFSSLVCVWLVSRYVLRRDLHVIPRGLESN